MQNTGKRPNQALQVQLNKIYKVKRTTELLGFTSDSKAPQKKMEGNRHIPFQNEFGKRKLPSEKDKEN